jgi:hypothetical protein
LETHDNPFWGFSNGGNKKKKKTTKKFSGTRVCRVAFGLQNGQNRVILGGRGGPRIFFLLKSFYFCYLGTHAKIWNPTTTPSGVLATAVTRKQQEEEKKKK